ncbi:MAG: PIN domain-containing protein [Actinomycetota bacterium]
MIGATLDSGALIAFEKDKRSVTLILESTLRQGGSLAVPAGVLAQVWRDGSRQARLARLLSSEVVEVVNLDDVTSRSVGQLLGATGTADVIDASVVLCARERDHPIVTTDPEDLKRIDPSVRLITI